MKEQKGTKEQKNKKKGSREQETMKKKKVNDWRNEWMNEEEEEEEEVRDSTEIFSSGAVVRIFGTRALMISDLLS